MTLQRVGRRQNSSAIPTSQFRGFRSLKIILRHLCASIALHWLQYHPISHSSLYVGQQTGCGCTHWRARTGAHALARTHWRASSQRRLDLRLTWSSALEVADPATFSAWQKNLASSSPATIPATVRVTTPPELKIDTLVA